MIRQMHHPEEITEALDLIWETFLQFDAPDYCDEGVSAFRDFIRDEGTVATLEFWGAHRDDELIGVIATNEHRKHICCFFVKSAYHWQGIGRRLWEYVLDHSDHSVYTVHASPYAVPVYHHLGFIDMDEEKTVDGMRFRPMRFERDDHGISN